MVHSFLCKIGSSDSGSVCCTTMQAASGYQHLRTTGCAHLHCSVECKEAVIPLKMFVGTPRLDSGIHCWQNHCVGGGAEHTTDIELQCRLPPALQQHTHGHSAY